MHGISHATCHTHVHVIYMWQCNNKYVHAFHFLGDKHIHSKVPTWAVTQSDSTQRAKYLHVSISTCAQSVGEMLHMLDDELTHVIVLPRMVDDNTWGRSRAADVVRESEDDSTAWGLVVGRDKKNDKAYSTSWKSLKTREVCAIISYKV